MKEPRIIVVGAGASGLAAAIAAAESGASVTVMEAGQKPGRSIMASGNGRCNFCNADLTASRYNDPAFVAAGMGDDPLSDVLGLFDRLGLWYFSDEEGRYFPRSRAAASVLDVLLNKIEDLGVRLWIDSKVADVYTKGNSWCVELDTGERFDADAVVWCAGGGTGGLLGRCADLPCVTAEKVLCPLATEPRPAKDLDGVRVVCEVAVERGGEVVYKETGEVLFRKYGISGIVVFDASRFARPGDTIVLDLAAQVGEDELLEEVKRRIAEAELAPDVLFSRLHLLDGALHPKVACHLAERLCGKNAERVADASRLAHLVKRWEFRCAGVADAEHGQVTRGGISNDSVDPASFECRELPGLYICGEALDVDGACGGLNLAWAWKSGMVAGAAAAVSCNDSTTR